MDLLVFSLVLVAAVSHATWNAWLKNSSPDFLGLAAIAIAWLLLGAIAIPLVGLPNLASVPYLVLTTIVHTVYAVLLVSAYKHGEFTLAYPIARGSGPLLVALAAPWFLDDTLEGPGRLAVTVIVSGIFLTGLAGTGARFRNTHAIFLAVATGVSIAAYTMIDAAGARASTSPHVYSAWFFFLSAAALLIAARIVHGPTIVTDIRPRLALGLTAGLLSAVAYWIVLWAMTRAPAALVASVRESSILFAALIGWGFLGEKITPLRWVGVVLVVVGLVLAKL